MIQRRVSIVLPVYNGAEYISESIRSILAQTYSEWELIIVNDCSTDDTLLICEKFANVDSRIRIISNAENRKLPYSLNVGFANATGTYYTWTSDDNIYKPTAIETMVKVLEENQDLDMVYSDYTVIDTEGNITGEVILKESQYNLTGNVCGACFLYTVRIAQKIGIYDVATFLAEDYDYWLRMLLQGRMKHICDNLYYYRYHAKALSQTKKDYVDEQTYRVLEKNFTGLYRFAVQHDLEFAFFDYFLEKGSAHHEETYKRLLALNKRYRYHRAKRFLKIKVNRAKKKAKRILKNYFQTEKKNA